MGIAGSIWVPSCHSLNEVMLIILGSVDMAVRQDVLKYAVFLLNRVVALFHGRTLRSSYPGPTEGINSKEYFRAKLARFLQFFHEEP